MLDETKNWFATTMVGCQIFKWKVSFEALPAALLPKHTILKAAALWRGFRLKRLGSPKQHRLEREKSGWGMAATRGGGHTATSVWESGREKWGFIIKDAKAGKGHMVCPFQKLHNVLLRLPFHDLSACLDLAFLRPLISLARVSFGTNVYQTTEQGEQSKQQFIKRCPPQDLRWGP